MSKVSTRWVPKHLTEVQKASRLTIAKEHLGHLNHHEKNDIAETILSSTKKNMKNFLYL